MPIELKREPGNRTIEVDISGKLEAKDYEHFAPMVERAIAEHGKIRILLVMHDFHGWTPGALWEDIKFDLKHFRDIERLAMIGESRWEHGMALVCRPFTTAEIRYFDPADEAAARTWIDETSDVPMSASL